ncbi:CIA30 family protein [Shimia sp. NS0008-38b]|uniref:CIA30 family protein n=1 Tax=Shimia sp. NS0008-38b TaxID=3127653 RepID=UPI0033422EE3
MRMRECFVASLVALSLSSTAGAEAMFETFESDPATSWTYLADTVMGGVSAGSATFERDATGAFVRLAGQVSTDNNGGFIQVRRSLSKRLPSSTEGVRLKVRGNGDTYFVHLRTKGTRLPWQYYQAQFSTTSNWSDIQLPLDTFKPSGQFLRQTPRAETITSIGIVAFGRDHTAFVDVHEVDWYEAAR